MTHRSIIRGRSTIHNYDRLCALFKLCSIRNCSTTQFLFFFFLLPQEFVTSRKFHCSLWNETDVLSRLKDYYSSAHFSRYPSPPTFSFSLKFFHSVRIVSWNLNSNWIFPIYIYISNNKIARVSQDWKKKRKENCSDINIGKEKILKTKLNRKRKKEKQGLREQV